MEEKTTIFFRKINRIKHFGIKKNLTAYAKIIKDKFKEEDVRKLVDGYFGKEDVQKDLIAMLNIELDKKELEKIIKLFEDTFDKGGRRVLNTKGKSIMMGKVLNKTALAVLIKEQPQYFSNILKEISIQIGKILADSYEKGLGIEAVKDILVEKIPHIAEVRAERIVRSEFIKCSAMGTRQGMKEAGIKKYIWLSARDSKVCPICEVLDGKSFEVNNESAPLPVSGSHPNCRCVIISL